jgi:hypothetical protein
MRASAAIVASLVALDGDEELPASSAEPFPVPSAACKSTIGYQPQVAFSASCTLTRFCR